MQERRDLLLEQYLEDNIRINEIPLSNWEVTTNASMRNLREEMMPVRVCYNSYLLSGASDQSLILRGRYFFLGLESNS
jgi:hypothetical protein